MIVAQILWFVKSNYSLWYKEISIRPELREQCERADESWATRWQIVIRIIEQNGIGHVWKRIILKEVHTAQPSISRAVYLLLEQRVWNQNSPRIWLTKQFRKSTKLSRRRVNMDTRQSIGAHSIRNTLWNERLENIGWGLFLIIVGVTFLGPEVEAPVGVWLIGAGLIMLGLNAIRYFSGIKTSSFTIGLGSLALVAGIASAFSVKIFGVLLILFGAGIIIRPFFEKEVVTGSGAAAAASHHGK